MKKKKYYEVLRFILQICTQYMSENIVIIALQCGFGINVSTFFIHVKKRCIVPENILDIAF